MSEERTAELVRELAQDLTPVRPIPPLRGVLIGVLALWALVAVPGTLLRGLRSEPLEALLAAQGTSWVFAALTVSGFGGIVAALALSVPGRELLAKIGLGFGLLGLAVAAGIGTLLVLNNPNSIGTLLRTGDLACLGVAGGVALLPAAAVVWFVGRAAPYRPVIAVLAAAAGMAALGAVAAQASCPYGDPRHLVVGHILAPVVGAILLTLPLLAALRRLGHPRVE